MARNYVDVWKPALFWGPRRDEEIIQRNFELRREGGGNGERWFGLATFEARQVARRNTCRSRKLIQRHSAFQS